jgi:hypothetical protein
MMADNSVADLEYYSSLPPNMAKAVSDEQGRLLSFLRNMVIITSQYKQLDLNREIDNKVQKFIGLPSR